MSTCPKAAPSPAPGGSAPNSPRHPAAGRKNDWLHFNGINYRANIWLNGQKIADAKDVAGTYRTFEFNVIKFLKHGGPNALAVEIFAPGKDDLGITWVDWNPTPPDKDMGIWKEVFLTAKRRRLRPQSFRVLQTSDDYKAAALTVYADLQNTSDHPVRGILRAEFDDIKSARTSTGRRRNEDRQIRPRTICRPETRASATLVALHHGRTVSVSTPKFLSTSRGHVSDSATHDFGIREVTSELTDKGYRLFKINGRNVLIRGAAWAPDHVPALVARARSTPIWRTFTTWA